MLHRLFADHDHVLHLEHAEQLEDVHRREVVTHRAGAFEVDDRALVVRDIGQLVLFDQLDEPVGQSVAGASRLDAGVVLCDLLDRDIACHRGQRISRQSTADVSLLRAAGNARRHQVDEVASAAYAARSGIAARNDLAEDGQVGSHVEQTLRAAETNSESGDDFVEDEDAAVLVAQRPDALVVVPIDGSGARFGSDRLDDDRSGTAAQLVEFEIVFKHIEVVGSDLVDDGEDDVGDAERLEELSGAGHFESVDHLIGPAVICAADLDDSLLLGRASRDTDRSHDRLGAASEHTEFLDIGHVLVDLLRDQQFRLVEQTGDGSALLDQLDRLFLHRREVAAQNGRAARLQEVDVLVAVDVGEICPLRLGHAHREGLVEGEVVLNAARNILFGFRGDLLGLGALDVIVFGAYLFVFLFGNAVNILIGEFFETLIDLLSVCPARDAVMRLSLAGKSGISYLHNCLLKAKIWFIRLFYHNIFASVNIYKFFLRPKCAR